MAADLDDEEVVVERRSPLRLILIILLTVVGLCVLCFLLSRVFGTNLLSALPFSIPGVTPAEEAPAPGLTTDTPTPALSPEAAVTPLAETGEPIPGTEQPVPGESPTLPATSEPIPDITESPTVPATSEPIPGTAEPTGSPMPGEGEHEMPAEGTATATTAPVPGPTVTPVPGGSPTVIVTIEPDCDANVPPTADANGPYTAMRGKGQAFVTFDGSGSTDPDGMIGRYEWDFGDGSATETGESVTHGYTSTGSYTVRLIVVDDCGATAEDTAEVTIVGPTPPSYSTGTATPAYTVTPPSGTTPPAATGQPGSDAGTLGFCYRVQHGDTLLGIARYFGVPVVDLADVNGVSPNYFVIAGQGLFIPMEPPQAGPNTYEVQAGDTLSSIAFQCGLTAATLANANGLTPDQNLAPGQFLVIPLWGY